MAKKMSPKTRTIDGDASIKIMFTCSEQLRRRLRGRLARDGINQSELLRAFVLAYAVGRQTGGPLGLEISVRRKD